MHRLIANYFEKTLVGTEAGNIVPVGLELYLPFYRCLVLRIS